MSSIIGVVGDDGAALREKDESYNGHAGYMGAVRWVSFSHHGGPESGEVRTMDDGSVWARIAGSDPKGDDDRWVMLLDPAGVEASGVSEVRFHDMTMSVAAGDALPLPDDVRARFARTDFILDMYESGVYDREKAGEKLFDHLFGKGRTVMDSEG